MQIRQISKDAESYIRKHWLVGTYQRRLVCRAANRAITTVLGATGGAKFVCPICDYNGPFFSYMSSENRRRKAMCPGCGSLERHRLQRLVLDNLPERPLFNALHILHLAPEPFLERYFRQIFGKYTSADITGYEVDYVADITKLPFENESFDVVYASHVLEHVHEDRKALTEVHRVLRPNGLAILPVPISGSVKTVEYSEPNPFETYHVRQPGIDYYDRYCEVFARVIQYSSEDFKPECQLFIYEDRTKWPTPHLPHRQPSPGEKHVDIVPVCYK